MKKIILFLFIVLLPALAHAKIYIVIDEVSTKKFPIAIPALQTLDGGHNELTENVTTLLRKDMRLAGIFRVLDEASYLEKDRGLENIDFSKWKAIEAYALVKGIVEPKGGGKALVELRLYDTETEQLLVGKQYLVFSKDYPVAVHKFTDELMLALTGVKGPFNSRVVAACGRSNARQIYTFAMDGTEKSILTKTKSNNISPNWAPDGSRVAFTSFNNFYPEIFTVGVDGKGFKPLTRNAATNLTPAFSPNGSQIAFASSKSGDTELYLMDLSGKISNQLTKTYNIDVSSAWSPDGSQIVFASERAGNLHLFVMDVASGSVSRLTYTGYQNDQPDWSPDGRKIIFTARDRGAFDLFVMNADGSLIQRITRDEGNNESPTWSPDGRYIVFSSGRRGGSGIYVSMADGDNQTLIPGTESCVNPDWGPRLQ
ncbi:MAG TPA: Tol-Pal system beta propeller repeat protein TolB [Deltaproteobacteria bacterium]|nr:MAG: Tol-Pal system beta propeller repeat protein TolB [Deltaproteobacteria bacterium GWA2_45_12]HBF12628.1 Tol-Pal system beta propeller repeat protein TolB [Deltaproteobacteria bacterium]